MTAQARYITTPLYYVNARPHLGHGYTTILADVLKRHSMQRGEKVTFLTGTDEHGDKIARMAAEQGKTPQQLADEVSSEFRETWEKMGLGFDIFYRTTSPHHIKSVQYALQFLKDKGEIEFREYEGNYCVGCERFLTDTELTAEGLCPDHQRKPEHRKEGNYFFLMSRYQNQLIDYFTRNPQSVQPDHYRNEVLSFLKQPLEDLCISRPKERLQWGIEIPFDPKFVTYVWFDALLNYLVATGWPEKKDYAEMWSTVTHLTAKDIVKTHSVYWCSMLMALGVKPPQHLQIHGYWLIGGTKMSKSLGNAIRPLELEAQYGLETLRFYLLREMSFGLDSTFTLESYVNCINAYLANGIGNLASRVMTLCQKNFVGAKLSVTADEQGEVEHSLLSRAREMCATWDSAFGEIKYQNALKGWSELVIACDLYINDQKPWALAKDPAQSERLRVVLGTCLQVLQTLGVMIYPVLPQASEKLCVALGLGEGRQPVAQALNWRTEYTLSAEVPKLFMRVALPMIKDE